MKEREKCKTTSHHSQTFLVKYKHMQSLHLCEDQGIPGKLRKRVRNLVLASLTTYIKTRL